MIEYYSPLRRKEVLVWHKKDNTGNGILKEMSLSKQRNTAWSYSCEQSAVYKFANAHSNTMVGS